MLVDDIFALAIKNRSPFNLGAKADRRHFIFGAGGREIDLHDAGQPSWKSFTDQVSIKFQDMGFSAAGRLFFAAIRTL